MFEVREKPPSKLGVLFTILLVPLFSAGYGFFSVFSWYQNLITTTSVQVTMGCQDVEFECLDVNGCQLVPFRDGATGNDVEIPFGETSTTSLCPGRWEGVDVSPVAPASQVLTIDFREWGGYHPTCNCTYGGFAFLGTRAAGMLTKLNLSSFEEVGSIELDERGYCVSCFGFDSVLFVVSFTPNATVTRILISPFRIVETTSFELAIDLISSVVSFSSGRYAGLSPVWLVHEVEHSHLIVLDMQKVTVTFITLNTIPDCYFSDSGVLYATAHLDGRWLRPLFFNIQHVQL